MLNWHSGLIKNFSCFAILLTTSLSIALPAHAGQGGNRNKLKIEGLVSSGSEAIKCKKVSVYLATSVYARSYILGNGKCDKKGRFSFRYKNPKQSNAVLYVVADARPNRTSKRRKNHHKKAVRLATVLDSQASESLVVINERTTVATAYAMAQFIEDNQIGGPSPGLQNAAATVSNLVELTTGNIGQTLASVPNGPDTSALPTLNTLSNMLSSCVRQRDNCDDLFQSAATLEGGEPRNTLDAAINIAHSPGKNVSELLAIAQLEPVYSPALEADANTNSNDPNFINSWVLAVRYRGDGEGEYGQKMDGPGNIAFDSEGNAWVNNNYAFGADPSLIVCGSTQVMKLTPTGHSAPGAPYGGDDEVGDGYGAGGLYGAGFGIAVDAYDNAWVTNFGFQGQPPTTGGTSPVQIPCANNADALAVSVSQFAPTGEAISPDGDPINTIPGGYRILGQEVMNGPLVDLVGQPQGIESDTNGNIWFAGCINGTISRFRDGDPTQIDFLDVVGLDKGFDVAVDANNHVWMTGNGTNNVVEMDQNFNQVGDLVDGFLKPMGIASDSLGNLWVSEAGISNPPCPALAEAEGQDLSGDGSDNLHAGVGFIGVQNGGRDVQHFRKDRPLEPPRAGLRWPWGIAVDGADNVWVANFTGQTIMQFCGAEAAVCPIGHNTGDPISPDNGYYNNALQRVTAVQIDPSGNVWMTNNWITDAFSHPENPGGHEVVVFIGLATPVVTPLIGTPIKP